MLPRVYGHMPRCLDARVARVRTLARSLACSEAERLTPSGCVPLAHACMHPRTRTTAPQSLCSRRTSSKMPMPALMTCASPSMRSSSAGRCPACRLYRGWLLHAPPSAPPGPSGAASGAGPRRKSASAAGMLWPLLPGLSSTTALCDATCTSEMGCCDPGVTSGCHSTSNPTTPPALAATSSSARSSALRLAPVRAPSGK